MASETTSGRLAPVFAVSLLLICSAGAFCQQSSQTQNTGPSTTNTQSPSNPTPGNKSSTDDNAFPTAESEAAAKAAAQQSPPSAPQGNVPQTGSGGSKHGKSSASQDNPFPEAQSKAAARPDSGSAPARGSSNGYSSSDAHLPDPAVGQGDFNSHQRPDSFTRDQTMDGRIDDDLKVADFYMKNGNYHGAYLRYQDAIQYDPQNDVALYGIADAMCKQHLTAEAMARFKSYAKNNPQGKYALKAEKMLAHPNKCIRNY